MTTPSLFLPGLGRSSPRAEVGVHLLNAVRLLSMKTAPEILFTAAEIAAYAGVDQSALKGFEPAGFGVPGHWRLVGGLTVYTLAGARLLAQSIAMSGNEPGAIRLLDGVNAIEAAAVKVAPVKVATPKQSDWRTRADLQ